MSTATTTSTRQVELPRVNLLPPEIFEKRQLQRAQAGLSLVVLVAIVGLGLVYNSGGGAVTDAKSRLQAAQDTRGGLEKQLATYSYVTAQQEQASEAQAMLTQASASAIPFSSLLANLSLLTPKPVWFTSLTLTNAIAPGSLTASTPVPATVGSISFQGKGSQHNDVATWLDSLALHSTELGFANPYFQVSTESLVPGAGSVPGTKVQTWVTFNSTVNLTPTALCSAESGKC